MKQSSGLGISILAILVFMILVFAPVSTADTSSETAPCIQFDQHTKMCGVYQAVQVSANDTVTVHAYKGIKYAMADIWQPPEIMNTYKEETYNASNFGDVCIQIDTNTGHSAGSVTQDEESEIKMMGSTDCLFLNIWTKSEANPAQAPARSGESGKPVLFFIHGGAFIEGAGSDAFYNGGFFSAANDVVLVTINYRLGAFGYMPVQGAEKSGNFGIEDQVAALAWVKRNISKFGGDPDKVTIFGESAGAMSVGLHMFSMTASNQYFRAGIMESNPIGYRYPDQTDVEEIRKLFAKCLHKKLGCLSLDARWPTQTPSADEIFKAQIRYSTYTQFRRIKKFGVPGFLPFTPIVDQRFILGQPINFYGNAGPVKKPFVFGFNRNEGVLFAGAAREVLRKGQLHTGLLQILGADIVYCNSSRSGKKQDSMNPVGLLADNGFKCLLEKMFDTNDHKDNAQKILDQASHDYNPRSIEASVDSWGETQQAYTAMANLITDFSFACANTQAPSSTKEYPVWGYLFNQAPVHKSLPNIQACDPTRDGGGNFTCHEAELPFVFHNALEVNSTAVQALSHKMNKGWAAFAKDPYSNIPIEGWQPWDKQNPDKTILQLGQGGMVLRLAATGKPMGPFNCSFWKDIKPKAN